MIRIMNIASIKLTIPMEAIDEGKDKTTIYIEAVEGVYTKEINNTKETRKQDSCKRDAISITN